MDIKRITLKASIIIPIYNQYESLKKVLQSFSRQNIINSQYQIIIVDDGSNDDLAKETSYTMSNRYKLDIRLHHQINKGRAAARNSGIKLADNQVLIFCDADRVPCEDYVYNHLLLHERGECVVVGNQYDIFYKSIDELFENTIDWERIKRFSRQPNYFSRVSKLYDGSITVVNNLYWLSFLVGNSSIDKDLLVKSGGFDEDFVDWGFEHFELGLRLQKQGVKFNLSWDATNFHIPHRRITGFYMKMVDSSMRILSRKHFEVNIDVLKKVLFENVEVSAYNSDIFLKNE